MSEEQHEQPEEKPDGGKSPFSFLWQWKLHGNKDTSYPDQQGGQPAPIENGLGGFIKDYGFQIIIILINGTLAWYTANLYHTAVSQSESAKMSAQAARDAVDQYRRANDLAERSFESNNKSARDNFDLSKQSLQNQTNSLDESRKDFEISVRPYLQIKNFDIKTFEDGQLLIVDFLVLNLGNQPLKVLTGKMAFRTDIVVPPHPFDSLKSVTESGYNLYVSKESPNASRFRADVPVRMGAKAFVDRGIVKLFLLGDLIYKNLVTQRNAHCLFFVRLAYPTLHEWTMYYDNNFYGKVPKHIVVTAPPR